MHNANFQCQIPQQQNTSPHLRKIIKQETDKIERELAKRTFSFLHLAHGDDDSVASNSVIPSCLVPECTRSWE